MWVIKCAKGEILSIDSDGDRLLPVQPSKISFNWRGCQIPIKILWSIVIFWYKVSEIQINIVLEIDANDADWSYKQISSFLKMFS